MSKLMTRIAAFNKNLNPRSYFLDSFHSETFFFLLKLFVRITMTINLVVFVFFYLFSIQVHKQHTFEAVASEV